MARVEEDLDFYVLDHPTPMSFEERAFQPGSRIERNFYRTVGSHIMGVLDEDPDRENFSLVVRPGWFQPLVSYTCHVYSPESPEQLEVI